MGGWRSFGAYSLSRVALFAAVLAVLLAVGLRGAAVVLLALLVSGVASYFLVSRQRTALATHVDAALASRRAGRTSRTAREDALADRIIAEHEGRER
jgi:hypothetical protein